MTVNLTINEDICKKHGLSASEVLLLCLYNLEDTPSKCKENLISKGYITSFNIQKEFAVTPEGNSIMGTILLESDPKVNQDRGYTALAKQLKELFPKGKKFGTNMYWTDGIPLIIKRLKLFFRKYDPENLFTDEQIIGAAKKYVDSFNGEYSYMKLLKYFIFKEGRNAIGEVESTSDLYTYIENADEQDTQQMSIDWETELR